MVVVFWVAVLVGFLWWLVERFRRRRHAVLPGLQAQINLPHDQPFELYHNAFSLCSMKTRACLSELGIAYRCHPIDLIETGAYENIRPALLRVNPAGTVPVLLHNGHPIYESHEQLRYAATFSEKGKITLTPSSEVLKQKMEYWIDKTSLTSDPMNEMHLSAGNSVAGLTLPMFAAMMPKISAFKITEGLLFHFDKRRPLLFLTFKVLGLKRFYRLKPVYKFYCQARVELREHLHHLEKQLNSFPGKWILGDQFTLADVGWMVIFERLEQTGCLQEFVSTKLTPECEQYWQAIKRRPSYRHAIVEYSHSVVEFGTERITQLKAKDPEFRRAMTK